MTPSPISKQVIIDVAIFFIICIPPVALFISGKQTTTGFWCNDQSLSLPYKPDTVSQTLLLLSSFGTPFVVMLLTESIRAAMKAKPRKYKSDMLSLAKAYGVFLFGIATTLLFTDSLKFSVGRLRPHFFDLCKPDFGKANCTDGIDRPVVCRLMPRNRWSRFNLLLAYVALFFVLKLIYIPVTDVLYSKAIWDLILGKKPPPKTPRRLLEDLTDTALSVPCGNLSHYDALILVHTAHSHFVRRHEYRQTYGNFQFTKPYRFKLVFLLGQPPNSYFQNMLERENHMFWDTVQGSFADTYRNLTYKAITGFRWVSEFCHHVNLVIKMDDDVLFNAHKFFEEFWPQPHYASDMLHCHGWKHPYVERHGKWAITKNAFGDTIFPPYCSGFFVVIPAHLVHDFYRVGRALPFLWIDDVFIYGIVRKEVGAQFVFMDQLAFQPGQLEECMQLYGYRCKYIGAVVDREKPFVKSLLSLVGGSLSRVDRLRGKNTLVKGSILKKEVGGSLSRVDRLRGKNTLVKGSILKKEPR